ncbi:MAG: 4Fe-4S dicluster domain-containing protein, partial [Nitrososphaeria archaeon]
MILQDKIRDAVGSLLREKRVDLVIAHEVGTLPLRATPCFVIDPDDAERIILDPTCSVNLATFFPNRKDKVGLVAKSCEARAALIMASEHQFPRENLVIVSAPCRGVVDTKKVQRRFSGKEILAAKIEGDRIIVQGKKFRDRLPLTEFLSDSCLECRHPEPILDPSRDVFIEEESAVAPSQAEAKKVIELEKKTPDERWAYFVDQFKDCIGCNACREVCPMCYCKECFADQTAPRWVGKSGNTSDTMVFHLVRVLHMAGRCVDCGACSRVCPMNIDIRMLTKKIEKDARELFAADPGVREGEAEALATFSEKDPQEF